MPADAFHISKIFLEKVLTLWHMLSSCLEVLVPQRMNTFSLIWAVFQYFFVLPIFLSRAPFLLVVLLKSFLTMYYLLESASYSLTYCLCSHQFSSSIFIFNLIVWDEVYPGLFLQTRFSHLLARGSSAYLPYIRRCVCGRMQGGVCALQPVPATQAGQQRLTSVEGRALYVDSGGVR